MEDDGQLTKEQCDNWRKAMVPVLGPGSMFLSDEAVQELRDKMQESIDRDNPDNE